MQNHVENLFVNSEVTDVINFLLHCMLSSFTHQPLIHLVSGSTIIQQKFCFFFHIPLIQ